MLILAALFTGVLVGCGPVPRPFQPDEKSDPEGRLLPPDRTGVSVMLVDGLPDDAAGALAAAIAAELREREIIAGLGAPTAGRLALVGTLGDVIDGRPRFNFELRDPRGAVLLAHETAAMTIAGEPSDAATWLAAAREIAAAISTTLQASVGRIAVAQSIKIGAVTGAPAGGDIVLARALAFSLRRAGVTVADDADAGAFAVTGSIRVAAKDQRERRLAVLWTLRRPDGTSLGDIHQENDITLDYLGQKWPDLAQAIAEGAADGIAELLQRSTAARR